MKILYDLIYLENEQHGGISRMWVEYFKKIYRYKLNVSFLSKPHIDNIAQSYLRSINYCDTIAINESSYSNRLLIRINRLNFLRNIILMRKIPKNVDIFHSTGYANPLIKRNNLKIVTTVHDMVFWEQRDNMKKSISYWDNIWGIYHSLKISDQIITVSETSKKSIIKYFPWAEKKINVIYHGLPEDFMKVEINPIKKKYFMFIGGRNEYKNYDLLLESFALYIKQNPDWELRVVGQNNHTLEAEKERYDELGISNFVNDYGLVDQKLLINIIQSAAAVVIPSLNEGFNFPLLEAMACGSPILSSDIPVSKEIGKGYVSYFSNNKESLLQAMLKIKNNDVDYNNLNNARNYAHTFNWDNSYKKLLKVYNSCIMSD